MTKTVTINYKGGSRRIELEKPNEKIRAEIISDCPKPFRMGPQSLAHMIFIIELGSELDRSEIMGLSLPAGLSLIKNVLRYWGEDRANSDKGEGDSSEFDELELDEDGTVDLEDME